jgi:hypothetical protein
MPFKPRRMASGVTIESDAEIVMEIQFALSFAGMLVLNRPSVLSSMPGDPSLGFHSGLLSGALRIGAPSGWNRSGLRSSVVLVMEHPLLDEAGSARLGHGHQRPKCLGVARLAHRLNGPPKAFDIQVHASGRWERVIADAELDEPQPALKL